MNEFDDEYPNYEYWVSTSDEEEYNDLDYLNNELYEEHIYYCNIFKKVLQQIRNKKRFSLKPKMFYF